MLTLHGRCRLQEQFGGAGGGDALGGIADGIMRQLLSKDVLYQPMKDIGERYPAWLEAHKSVPTLTSNVMNPAI